MLFVFGSFSKGSEESNDHRKQHRASHKTSFCSVTGRTQNLTAFALHYVLALRKGTPVLGKIKPKPAEPIQQRRLPGPKQESRSERSRSTEIFQVVVVGSWDLGSSIRVGLPGVSELSSSSCCIKTDLTHSLCSEFPFRILHSDR